MPTPTKRRRYASLKDSAFLDRLELLTKDADRLQRLTDDVIAKVLKARLDGMFLEDLLNERQTLGGFARPAHGRRSGLQGLSSNDVVWPPRTRRHLAITRRAHQRRDSKSRQLGRREEAHPERRRGTGRQRPQGISAVSRCGNTHCARHCGEGGLEAALRGPITQAAHPVRATGGRRSGCGTGDRCRQTRSGRLNRPKKLTGVNTRRPELIQSTLKRVAAKKTGHA